MTTGSSLVTEFKFELPLGYVDSSGETHKSGVMRLSTARDEIMPLRDPRVRENEAYLTVVLLSRVVSTLGSLSEVTPGVIEGLFSPDIAFLQDLYAKINSDGRASMDVSCPNCETEISVDMTGGSPGEF